MKGSHLSRKHNFLALAVVFIAVAFASLLVLCVAIGRRYGSNIAIIVAMESPYRSGDMGPNVHAETLPAGELSSHRTSSNSRQVRSNGCLESRRLSSASRVTITSQDHRVGDFTLLGCAASRAARIVLTWMATVSSRFRA